MGSLGKKAIKFAKFAVMESLKINLTSFQIQIVTSCPMKESIIFIAKRAYIKQACVCSVAGSLGVSGPPQSYSEPMVMLISPGWMWVAWYHVFVSTTTETHTHTRGGIDAH